MYKLINTDPPICCVLNERKLRLSHLPEGTYVRSPERTQPYAVNDRVEEHLRRIPFENMIYVGDGLTDVPCFSLIGKFGGKAFGVFDPTKADAPKKAWERLAAPRRVTTLNSPRYGPKDDLGALLRAAVEAMCLKLDVRTKTTSALPGT
jgi:hypothetical protein